MNEVVKRPESLINGRYVIGTPAGTFEEKPRIAQQPGKMSHRSDWSADISHVGDMLVMSASIRGAMHYGLRTIRQDSYAIGVEIDSNDNTWLIAAITDGVSSATQSHTFADYMARQTVTLVGEELISTNPKTLHNIEWSKISRCLVEISEEFCRNAAKRTVSEDKTDEIEKASLKDFINKWATTLEFAVIQANSKEQVTKREYVHVAVAGDGAAYILSKIKGWEVIKTAKKQTGAIATNAVLSLPLSPNDFVINFGYLRKNDCFILTTDGLGDFIDDGKTALGDFFQRKLPKCESLVSFLQIVDVSLYQADDDRTIIMIKGT
ncbi:MAG: protein phosphatase 2C domain-containing protein [Oscillospiraceae bacterium]|jgi:serine/threonine protein phosphatase PrpC|nr:protein phosphatase 2C domain-containing protein [Oscillospiraceae bacterium]